MNLFAELRRRNVFRVSVAYAVLSWVLLQVADVLFETLGLPMAWQRGLLALLILGFVPVVVFSWAYELTPEGLRREVSVSDDSAVKAHTGQRLNYITIGMVILGIALLLGDRFINRASGPEAGADGAASRTSQTFDARQADESNARSGQSIAVLPFVNLSANPENEYFADGLTEELLNQLAQIPQLMVAGRTSSFSFKGKNEDLRDIGNALGVANVLEGSVRRQGDDIRVTAQLIRVSDGFHLWSENYDRQLEDVFAIQDDIAGNVAEALKIILDDDAWRAMEAVGVRNVEAFVAYQKGSELYQLAHGEGPLLETLEAGMTYFKRAVDIVPDFGTAYWTMADYHAHVILDGEDSTEARARSLRDLRQALDEAHEHSPDPSRRAFIDVDRALFSGDWTTLPSRIEAAINTEGCPDPAWIEIAVALGYAERLIPVWERHQRCEPLSWLPYYQLAESQLFAGRAEAALDTLQQARQQFGASSFRSALQASVLISLGRTEDAFDLAPEFVAEPVFFGWRAESLPLAAEGRLPEAQAALDRWMTEYGPMDDMPVLAALGQRERVNELAAEIDAKPAGPFELLMHARFCSCGALWDLSATPNFQGLIEQAGIQWPPPTLIDYPAKDW